MFRKKYPGLDSPNTRNAYTVVRACRGASSHPGSMALKSSMCYRRIVIACEVGVGIGRITSDKIPSTVVVDKPIAVVIDSVGRKLGPVGVKLARQIGVTELPAGIDDGYGD